MSLHNMINLFFSRQSKRNKKKLKLNFNMVEHANLFNSFNPNLTFYIVYIASNDFVFCLENSILEKLKLPKLKFLKISSFEVIKSL